VGRGREGLVDALPCATPSAFVDHFAGVFEDLIDFALAREVAASASGTASSNRADRACCG
jgi:hypothetical protein